MVDRIKSHYTAQFRIDRSGAIESEVEMIDEDFGTNRYSKAVRHANGKDWWVLLPSSFNKVFRVYKYADGVFAPHAEFPIAWEDLFSDTQVNAPFCVSNDGSRGLIFDVSGRALRFRFDRCTGAVESVGDTFSLSVSNEASCNYYNRLVAAQFSPNDERLYLLTQDSIFAISDASALFEPEGDPAAHAKRKREVIHGFPNARPGQTRDPNGYHLNSNLLLMPDNKLYVSRFFLHCQQLRLPFSNMEYLGVIHRPNESGSAVEYEFDGLHLGKVHAYRLIGNRPIDPGPLVTAHAGGDSLSVCPGDSVRLGRWADERHLTYEWRPDDGLSDPTNPTPWAKPERTTTYTLTVRPRADLGPECATRDSHSDTITVHVRPGPPPFSLGASRFLCPDQWPVQLSGPAGPYLYRWSTGDTTESILAFEPGTYALSVSDAQGACPRSASVDLNATDLPELPDWQTEYEVCPPATQLSLGADSIPGFTYRWNDGASSARRAIFAEGPYSLTITSQHGCSDDVSTFVRVWPPAEISVEPLPNPTWCPARDGSIRLSANPSGQRYEWNTGERSRIIQADTGGSFRVVVRYSGECSDSALIWLPIGCVDAVYVPNAFSPNGDGLNETWHVLGGPFAEFHCAIYDRWGTLVFETSDPATGWHGGDQPEGAYSVVVRCRLQHSRERFFHKEAVELLR